jgi:hypothetical protein
MNKHIVQLIRERFYPLVRFCGPQSAGEVEIEEVTVNDAPTGPDVSNRPVTTGDGLTVKLLPLLDAVPTLTTTFPGVAPEGT